MDDDLTVLLVRRAQAGRDVCAFDALVRRFQDRAVAYARSLLRDKASAEDAAQEAFVQAWRDLPTLREAAAFPAWLRRIVFKHCDRIRRAGSPLILVPLDSAFHIAGGPTPVELTLASEDAERVRTALDMLPDREREAALLYYLGEHDLAAIGGFLGVPKTTVKSRLHAARGRLRRELGEMAGETLEHEKPSQDEEFAGRVLARILEEYREQMRADPHTADRALLDRGRECLFQELGKPGPLNWQVVRTGFGLLWNRNDHKGIASLLMRYLAQPLEDGPGAWAHIHLANALACAGDAAGAVLAHEVFERWLPGRKPCLSLSWPSDPVPAETTAEAVEGDDILLLALAKSGEFATAWNAVWRADDYLARVDAVLARVAATTQNRFLRFAGLRMACTVAENQSAWERAHGYIQCMMALGEEEDHEGGDGDRWRIEALGHEIDWNRRRGGEAGRIAKGSEALAVLLAAEEKPWVRGARHEVGHHLAWMGRYEEALLLFEANLATGGPMNSWGYLMHAAVLWKAKGDRARTLSLLREAAVRDARDLTEQFRTQAAFADVKDDPEFLVAVKRPG